MGSARARRACEGLARRTCWVGKALSARAIGGSLLRSDLVPVRAAHRNLHCFVSYCESTWHGDSWVIYESQPLPLLTASHNRGPITAATKTRPAVAHGCSKTW
ncbi:hypothetical protein IscW_ISCW002466 [Ixodes scapularis]|uniref:Uncharacterized protein n=1 Tax=Ixodes scapularis TaxID=6945 RepID=B7P9H7_IXOSC|nr:hypothetical protein IscW_ISCW002466 [Ixodes scapularis]|eukprot:XP_002404426.1 hypothetical protein IscW_ISCW002466 [Ixodes scapularis]